MADYMFILSFENKVDMESVLRHLLEEDFQQPDVDWAKLQLTLTQKSAIPRAIYWADAIDAKMIVLNC